MPAAAADDAGSGARTSRWSTDVAPLAFVDCHLGAVALGSLGVVQLVVCGNGRLGVEVAPVTKPQWWLEAER